MNFLRILVALLAIIALLAALPGADPHGVQFAVLPFICFLFAFSTAFRFEPAPDGFKELTAAPAVIDSRAPPRL